MNTRKEIKAELKKQGYRCGVSGKQHIKYDGDIWWIKDANNEYVMIGQPTARVEVFLRGGDWMGNWKKEQEEHENRVAEILAMVDLPCEKGIFNEDK